VSLLGCGSSAEVQFPSINTSWAIGGSIVRQAGPVEVPCERPKVRGTRGTRLSMTCCGAMASALPISGSISMRCVRSGGRSDLVDLRRYRSSTESFEEILILPGDTPPLERTTALC
jgi:hypothetical protein